MDACIFVCVHVNYSSLGCTRTKTSPEKWQRSRLPPGNTERPKALQVSGNFWNCSWIHQIKGIIVRIQKTVLIWSCTKNVRTADHQWSADHSSTTPMRWKSRMSPSCAARAAVFPCQYSFIFVVIGKSQIGQESRWFPQSQQVCIWNIKHISL